MHSLLQQTRATVDIISFRLLFETTKRTNKKNETFRGLAAIGVGVSNIFAGATSVDGPAVTDSFHAPTATLIPFSIARGRSSVASPSTVAENAARNELFFFSKLIHVVSHRIAHHCATETIDLNSNGDKQQRE